jgi:hypothetical protein
MILLYFLEPLLAADQKPNILTPVVNQQLELRVWSPGLSLRNGFNRPRQREHQQLAGAECRGPMTGCHANGAAKIEPGPRMFCVPNMHVCGMQALLAAPGAPPTFFTDYCEEATRLAAHVLTSSGAHITHKVHRLLGRSSGSLVWRVAGPVEGECGLRLPF